MEEINREVLLIALLRRCLSYIILKEVMCLSWDMSDGKEMIYQMAENSCSERDQVKLFPGVPCPQVIGSHQQRSPPKLCQLTTWAPIWTTQSYS